MSVTVVEGLAAAFQALTGMEAVSLGSTMMINNSGTWASVSTDAVFQIVKNSGAKIVGANAYPIHNGVLGSFSGLDYQMVFDVGGAQLKNCLATPVQISNASRAALQNGGAQIGNTVLKPVTDLVVQSTGSGQQVAVTTKGVLAKVGFDAALISAAAALGITIGVGIVETNPELVTKVYNKVFSDNIDPQYIADIVENTTVWENIRDGVTFLSEDFINAVKEVFFEEGVYGDHGLGDNVEVNDGQYSTVTSGIIIWESVPLATGNFVVDGTLGQSAAPQYRGRKWYGTARCGNLLVSEKEDAKFVYVKRPRIGSEWQPFYTLHSDGKFKSRFANGSARYQSSIDDFVDVTPYENNSTVINQTSVVSYTPGGTNIPVPLTTMSGGSRGNLDEGTVTTVTNLPYPFPIINIENGLTAEETAQKYFDTGEGSIITPTEPGVIGTSKKAGARYPKADKTLAEDYPEWDARSVETISDWNDETDLPNKRKWYPVNTEADQSTGQDDAQDGTVDENEMNDAINDIDNSMEENSDISPDTEPQPDIYPNPNPAPGTDLQPVTPDPPDIDASDGEDPDPTIPILTTVATSGLAHIYNPTLQEVRDLGDVLWTPSLIENIKKIFVNPMDGIIGFHILYATPSTSSEEEIVLGYYGTGVTSKVVKNQYVEVDCGYVAIDEWWNDARDYEPYVNVSMYLPFIGIVPLKANDVIGSHVSVKYHVDVLTGTCLAMVNIQKYNARGTIYQFVGNCAVTIPLSSGNYTAVITSLLSVASSAIGGAMIAGATGAAVGAARGVVANIDKSKLQVIQSGNLGANAGAMGIRNPFLIIRRPVTKDAYAYNMQYGYPAFKWVKLGQVKGFTRVRSIHLNDIKCTDEEKDMIEGMLKEGVLM